MFFQDGLGALTPSVLAALGVMYSLLLLSHLVTWIQEKRNPEKSYKEMHNRNKAWWAIFILLTVVFYFGKVALVPACALLSFGALREYFHALPHRRPEDKRVRLWLYLTIPIQYFLVFTENRLLFLVFIPVFVYLLFPIRMLLKGCTEGFLEAMGTLFWGEMMAVYSLSYVAFLAVLPVDSNPMGGEVGLILFLLFLTELNDASQFCWGKALGKTKVIPKISPNKTVEGLLGGVGTCILASYLIAPWLTALSPLKSLFAGLVISLGGFLGDITLSAIKRDAHIKDFGSLLPGHGGLLDRIDSLTITGPLFFYVLVL